MSSVVYQSLGCQDELLIYSSIERKAQVVKAVWIKQYTSFEAITKICTFQTPVGKKGGGEYSFMDNSSRKLLRRAKKSVPLLQLRLPHHPLHVEVFPLWGRYGASINALVFPRDNRAEEKGRTCCNWQKQTFRQTVMKWWVMINVSSTEI